MENTYNREIDGELFKYAIDFNFEGHAIYGYDGDIDTDYITCLIDLGVVDEYGVFVRLFEEIDPEDMPDEWPAYIKNQIQIEYNKLFDKYVMYAEISAAEYYADEGDYHEER